jgi:hypothetical protein
MASPLALQNPRLDEPPAAAAAHAVEIRSYGSNGNGSGDDRINARETREARLRELFIKDVKRRQQDQLGGGAFDLSMMVIAGAISFWWADFDVSADGPKTIWIIFWIVATFLNRCGKIYYIHQILAVYCWSSLGPPTDFAESVELRKAVYFTKVLPYVSVAYFLVNLIGIIVYTAHTTLTPVGTCMMVLLILFVLRFCGNMIAYCWKHKVPTVQLGRQVGLHLMDTSPPSRSSRSSRPRRSEPHPGPRPADEGRQERLNRVAMVLFDAVPYIHILTDEQIEIRRASCRERVYRLV